MKIMTLRQLLYTTPPDPRIQAGVIIAAGTIMDVADHVGAHMVEIGEAVLVAEAVEAVEAAQDDPVDEVNAAETGEETPEAGVAPDAPVRAVKPLSSSKGKR